MRDTLNKLLHLRHTEPCSTMIAQRFSRAFENSLVGALKLSRENRCPYGRHAEINDKSSA